jgi:hypothetical protein
VANELAARGFVLATNCGPGEQAIPGTVRWDGSLTELYAAVELGGWLISARSGICDLCSDANTKLHILQRDFSFVIYPGVKMLTSLAANCLTDRACYHTMLLDEAPSSFAAKILSHPDFEAF